MEMSWIDSHHDVMGFEEAWLCHVLQSVREKHGKEIAENFGVEVLIPSRPFPKVTMEDAQKILQDKGYVAPADTKIGDIDPQGERLLCEYSREQYGHEFIFVTDYPAEVRPFYHMRKEDNPTETKSFDLLWKWMEITTGAQREHQYEILVKQATEKAISLESIQFYLDFFKYGCPPHGGFGFGLARLLAAISWMRAIVSASRRNRRVASASSAAEPLRAAAGPADAPMDPTEVDTVIWLSPADACACVDSDGITVPTTRRP